MERYILVSYLYEDKERRLSEESVELAVNPPISSKDLIEFLKKQKKRKGKIIILAISDITSLRNPEKQ